jgi:hypothetical protein
VMDQKADAMIMRLTGFQERQNSVTRVAEKEEICMGAQGSADLWLLAYSSVLSVCSNVSSPDSMRSTRRTSS